MTNVELRRQVINVYKGAMPSPSRLFQLQYKLTWMI